MNDDWEIEYKELSEDYRSFLQVIWQSNLAVLAVDGILIGTVINTKPPINHLLGFIPLLASILTFLMSIELKKWQLRWESRISRLKQYDRMKGFGRFYYDETGVLRAPLAPLFLGLMLSVAIGLLVYSVFLFLGIQPFA